MSYRSELIQVAAVAVAAIQDLDRGNTEIGSYNGSLKREDILEEIRAERHRQEGKWGTQHHDPIEWFAILGEEVGEVANSILERDIV